MSGRILKLSAYQIDMYRKCPRQWAYRYIEGLRVPPSGAMKLSGVGHTVLEVNYRQKVQTGVDLPVDEMTARYAEGWKVELEKEEVIFDKDEKPGDVRDAGIASVKVHREVIAPTVIPAPTAQMGGDDAIEEWFSLKLQAKSDNPDEPPITYVLNGRIDITDIAGIVRDNKIVGKKPNAMDLAKNSQLSTYALAKRMITKQAEAGLALDIAIKPTKKKGARAISLPAERSRLFLVDHLNTIGHVARGIMANSFPRNETGWWCSEKFCGYWGRCVGKNLTVVDLGENADDDLEQKLEASLDDS